MPEQYTAHVVTLVLCTYKPHMSHKWVRDVQMRVSMLCVLWFVVLAGTEHEQLPDLPPPTPSEPDAKDNNSKAQSNGGAATGAAAASPPPAAATAPVAAH